MYPAGGWIRLTTPLVFFVLGVTGASGQQDSIAPEESHSYAVWRDGVKRFTNLRLTYDYRKGPTEKFLSKTQGKEYSGDGLMIVSSIGRRMEGELRVSRLGESLNRQEVLERFEADTRVWHHNPGSEKRYPAEPDKSLSYTEIHGDGVYYHYYPHKKRGAIWPEWDDRTHYPLAEVVPPDPATSRLTNVSDSGNVLDFVNEYNDLIRYHLDPSHGMMPIRIECSDILENGELFLYRYFTVEKYVRTENGAFLPVESTVHDLVRRRGDGSISVDARRTFTMTAYEENVQFGPEEFTYTFPDGTFVRNHIAGDQRVVGEESKLTS